jgi:predicted DNA-binding transcriptional regulator YafY
MPSPTQPTPKPRKATKQPLAAKVAPIQEVVIEERITFAALVRIFKIHQLLFEQRERDNGVRPWITAAFLAAELETTERTIGETITRMRDDFHLPAHYVARRGGYGYTEPVTQFPTVLYNRAECLALCVAMQGSAMYAGSSFAKHVRSVVRKLTAGLRKELAVEFESVERVISFHCTGADAFIPLENFELVTPALIHHQELEINYATAHREDEPLDGASDSEPGLRRVEPLHLACIDFGWYLFAYDPGRAQVRTFALRRIKGLRMTGTTFQPRPFNIRKALETSFGAFQGGKAENVRLRFWGRGARVIPEFFWHKSQVIEPVPGQAGTIDLTLRIAINPRFVGWIKEWLGTVAVLKPVPLRERVSYEARHGADLSDSIGAEYDRRKTTVEDA